MLKIKKRIKKSIYRLIRNALAEGNNTSILLVGKVMLGCTYSTVSLLVLGIIGVFINPIFGKIALGLICMDMLIMVVCMVSYQEIENYREKLEKDYINLYNRFLNEEFSGWSELVKGIPSELLNVLGGSTFKRFMRILKKINFSPSSKEDFANFNFKSDEFVNNSIYTIIVDDIIIFMKNLSRGTKSSSNTYSKKTSSELERALSYFGLGNNYSNEELRKAYKNKLKKVHPDAGGTEEEFLKAQKLYERIISS